MDTYHRRFGYVSPVAIPAVSVVLTGSWINLRVWAFSIFFCGILFMAELNDLRIEIIFVLVAWIMSTLGKRLYQVLFLIFVFTCTFYAAPMETREPVAQVLESTSGNFTNVTKEALKSTIAVMNYFIEADVNSTRFFGDRYADHWMDNFRPKP